MGHKLTNFNKILKTKKMPDELSTLVPIYDDNL